MTSDDRIALILGRAIIRAEILEARLAELLVEASRNDTEPETGENDHDQA